MALKKWFKELFLRYKFGYFIDFQYLYGVNKPFKVN